MIIMIFYKPKSVENQQARLSFSTVDGSYSIDTDINPPVHRHHPLHRRSLCSIESDDENNGSYVIVASPLRQRRGSRYSFHTNNNSFSSYEQSKDIRRSSNEQDISLINDLLLKLEKSSDSNTNNSFTNINPENLNQISNSGDEINNEKIAEFYV